MKARRCTRSAWYATALVACLWLVPAAGAQTAPEYVLVLSSFEQQFSPHNVFNGVFRAELTRRSPRPVQFIDVSLPSTPDQDPQADATLDYLKTTFAHHTPALIVSVGGVAAQFAQRYRAQIFPGTPMLFASVDRRFTEDTTFTSNDAAVAVAIDAQLLVENILRVLPATQTVAVVIGSSQLEAAWRNDLTAAFRPFAGRVTFVWYDNLSFEEMLDRSASLPPDSAILFAHLAIDAHGVPQVEDSALPQLHAVANAPIFGVYSSQLGQGVVGGPMLSMDELGRNTASVALRILEGESPGRLRPPPQPLGMAAFDARELERWHISEARLPARSAVLFRQPSAWQKYRGQIVATVSVGAVETILIAGLLTLYVKRRRAERLHQESERRFQVLADTAPVMIWMAGLDRKCTDFNRAWLEFTGRRLEQERGDGWLEGVHHDDVERCIHTFSNAFDRRELFRMEYRLRRSDGEYRWILDTGVPRFTADGACVGYTGSAIDVTEHKMARAALSNLSQKLMQAQEEERTRIARDLHDDVCQQVAALRIQLDALVQQLPGDQTALMDALRDLSRQALGVGADIQALSHRLHSSKLQLLGLSAAAASFCREFADQQKVTIRFTPEAVPAQLPDEAKIALFRVMQEALMNAVKYSGARDFDVTVGRSPTSLHLDVTDHGVGFDPESARAKTGLGLVSMRERLALIGGDLIVRSSPGHGTTIRASIPNVDPAPSPVSPQRVNVSSTPNVRDGPGRPPMAGGGELNVPVM